MYPNGQSSTIYNSQKSMSNPSAHQETTGLRGCGIYIMEYYSVIITPFEWESEGGRGTLGVWD